MICVAPVARVAVVLRVAVITVMAGFPIIMVGLKPVLAVGLLQRHHVSINANDRRAGGDAWSRNGVTHHEPTVDPTVIWVTPAA